MALGPAATGPVYPFRLRFSLRSKNGDRVHPSLGTRLRLHRGRVATPRERASPFVRGPAKLPVGRPSRPALETGVSVAYRECSRPACGPVPAAPLMVDV